MIFVVAGPTGTGKSKFAVRLAKLINGEIINGDAFQVYRRLDIGTVKPTEEQLAQVAHHLYDIVDIDEEYSVAEYQSDARRIIQDIVARGKTPIICGGTGLYIRATLFDYQFERLEPLDMGAFEEQTNEQLHAYLAKIDPASAQKIHPNNRRRVLRAIEIFLAAGVPKSELEAKQNHVLLYETTMLGLDIKRSVLYEHLDARVDRMIEEGLLAEIEDLLIDFTGQEKAFQAIGYKQVLAGKKKQQSIEEIIANIKKATRNYAKRQITFFKHQLPVTWFKDWDEALIFAEEQYEYRKN